MKPKEGWERLSRLLSTRVPKSEQNVNSKCIFSQFLFLWNVNLALLWAPQLKMKFQDSFRLISTRAIFNFFGRSKFPTRAAVVAPSKQSYQAVESLTTSCRSYLKPQSTILTSSMRISLFFIAAGLAQASAQVLFSWIIMYLWIW